MLVFKGIRELTPKRGFGSPSETGNADKLLVFKNNFGFLDFFQQSTAQGNMADISCDYGDFRLTVEVTMQSGKRQYEAEGEPVTRHLAKVKKKPINQLTVYLLHLISMKLV